MQGYKGFDKNLKCRGKQYTVGKTEVEESADLCNSGLHFCENPLDCFAYYPPADSRYCEVDADEVSEQKDDDSKRVAKKLTIGAEIGLDGIIKAGVKFILEKASETGDIDKCTGDWSAATNTGYQSAATNTGDWSAATNTGNWSAATNTGDQSAATNTGDQSAATNTGYQSAATNTGNQSAATNTGYQSAATNTGYQSAATNTGNRSAATNTGNQSAATNTGDWSAASVSGKNSVAIATGIGGKAKGAFGCAIVLCDYDDDGSLLHIASQIVDGDMIKPDTYYTLKNGVLVVAEDEP